MIRSWVRVRPVLKKGVFPVLAETCISFQVGCMLPLETIMNLISRETESSANPLPPRSTATPRCTYRHPKTIHHSKSFLRMSLWPGLQTALLNFLRTGLRISPHRCWRATVAVCHEGSAMSKYIAPISQSLIPKSLSISKGELFAGVQVSSDETDLFQGPAFHRFGRWLFSGHIRFLME